MVTCHGILRKLIYMEYKSGWIPASSLPTLDRWSWHMFHMASQMSCVVYHPDTHSCNQLSNNSCWDSPTSLVLLFLFLAPAPRDHSSIKDSHMSYLSQVLLSRKPKLRQLVPGRHVVGIQ